MPPQSQSNTGAAGRVDGQGLRCRMKHSACRRSINLRAFYEGGHKPRLAGIYIERKDLLIERHRLQRWLTPRPAYAIFVSFRRRLRRLQVHGELPARILQRIADDVVISCAFLRCFQQRCRLPTREILRMAQHPGASSLIRRTSCCRASALGAVRTTNCFMMSKVFLAAIVSKLRRENIPFQAGHRHLQRCRVSRNCAIHRD